MKNEYFYGWYDLQGKFGYPCCSLGDACRETRGVGNCGIVALKKGEWIPIWKRRSNWTQENGHADPGVSVHPGYKRSESQ